MSDHEVNADFSKAVLVHSADTPWQASPSPSVWRKRLDLAGPLEAGRVTSVVRYDPESRFHGHPHPEGEEILVLEGVFSDEHGHYPAGSFLLNPEGFSHAPFSEEGCVLFVKLRQYPGQGRGQVAIDTGAVSWQPTEVPGVEEQVLYQQAGYPETIRLLRLQAGTEVPEAGFPGGVEFFVLEGDLYLGEEPLKAGSWTRRPAGSHQGLRTQNGCRVYQKTGHLPLTKSVVKYEAQSPR